MKQIKRSKLFVIISAVIIFLIFICSAFSISIGEFKHKISCIKKMSDIYKEVSVQNVFESINKEISDCADNNSTNHYEILLPDGKELAENEKLVSQAEMEKFMQECIDSLPGIVHISTNVILSRIKDVKGLRL